MARKRKLEKDLRIPLEYGLDILSGRWNSRIIGGLSKGGPLRFSEIRAELQGVSDASLAIALQELEDAGMLFRSTTEIDNGKRTVIEYRLTEKGMSAVPILRSICAWSVQYHPTLLDTCQAQCKECPIARSAASGEVDE